MRPSRIAIGTSLFWGFVLAVVVFLFSAFPEWASRIAAVDAPFIQIGNEDRWSSNLSTLDQGHYLAQFGALSRACDLYADETKVDSNRKGTIPYRVTSNVSYAFSLSGDGSSPSRAKTITLDCTLSGAGTPLKGKTPAYHIHSYRTGVLIRTLRSLKEVLLGPLFSLLLFFMVMLRSCVTIFDSGNGGKALQEQWHRQAPILIFSLGAFLHSLSGADIPYYFLTESQSPYYYNFSRNLLSFSLLHFVAETTRAKVPLFVPHLVNTVLGYLILLFHPEQREWMYRLQMFFYVGITVMTATIALRTERRTLSAIFAQSLVISWILLQLPLFFRWALGVTLLSLPSPPILVLITASSVMVFIIWNLETSRQSKIEMSSLRILDVIDSTTNPRDAIDRIAEILSEQVRFSRISAYLDAYFLGASSRPSENYIRIMHSGYRKKTEQDERIDTREQSPFIRGKLMREAMKEKRIVHGTGEHDQAHYLIVPIGSHACFNFSNDRSSSAHSIFETLDIFERILPTLQPLERRLEDHAIRQGLALERLRDRLGEGRSHIQMGCVFVDINDFSGHTEKYGQSFADFVNQKYLPSLVNRASGLAVPEFLRGDEVYFLCLKEFVSGSFSLPEATFRLTQSILEYSRREGAELCRRNGFPSLTLSIGANLGEGVLIRDPLKVRTAGKVVNDAKRLQEAAPQDTAYVHAEAFKDLSGSHPQLGPSRPVLVKKNCIPARPLVA